MSEKMQVPERPTRRRCLRFGSWMGGQSGEGDVCMTFWRI